jgi:hypothetical protein
MNRLLPKIAARILSKLGHQKRAQTYEQRRRDLHDRMTSELNLPPIPWARGKG